AHERGRGEQQQENGEEDVGSKVVQPRPGPAPPEPPCRAVCHSLYERRAGDGGDGEKEDVVAEQRDGDEVRPRVAVRAEEAEEYRPAQTHVREVEEYPA